VAATPGMLEWSVSVPLEVAQQAVESEDPPSVPSRREGAILRIGRGVGG
jgi:hypothetical protein